ncbi:hypothetical protein LV84_02896 [Algoriphagus ratkowskyi]|uniref:Uncharacterized protein n=2 Tax=Algoriphagus ratkowskyi TaxID=57028 RepID=A0A2W7SVH7_9BACT|nr:hypothetical protein LV84_02896 [Algoriphagus ratkowskyi]
MKSSMIMRDSLWHLINKFIIMKTAIFTWLFLLPIQIYAYSYDSQFREATLENSTIEVEGMVNKNADLIARSEMLAGIENFQAIAASQEKDIQKLKSQLAHKNHEINSQELTQWKSQSATLIFFVGMLIFAFLYIRNKLHTDQSELITIHTYTPEK